MYCVSLAVKDCLRNHGSEIMAVKICGMNSQTAIDAAIAGASVTHIDASKKDIKLAFDNRNRNNLETLPIRYLVEDAVSFVKKEINRDSY